MIEIYESRPSGEFVRVRWQRSHQIQTKSRSLISGVPNHGVMMMVMMLGSSQSQSASPDGCLLFFYQMLSFLCPVHIHILNILTCMRFCLYFLFVCLGLSRLPPGIYSFFLFFGFSFFLVSRVLLDSLFWWFFCLFWCG